MTSARGLSFALMISSAICITGAVARMVMVLVVLLNEICGWIAMPATRISAVSSWFQLRERPHAR